VRLFLSSFRRLWIVGENLHSNQERDDRGKKRKADDRTSAITDKKKTPFYVRGVNYLSLLNIGIMIKETGSMRHCWEGENESYIQNFKREVSTMKHTEQYLKTILTKMLRTDVLDSFNETNPFSKAKKYSRTSHVRIYSRGVKYACVEDVFSQEDIVSGVIDKNGNLLVCFENHESNVLVFILSFSTTPIWQLDI
jgi:hypothetical protein